MRIWSIHPKYLDAKGLVALWRETLLAQNVLQGQTRGYRSHPQLIRFRQTRNPIGAIASYLRSVEAEAASRGYRFDRAKIANRRLASTIPVNRGQVEYEHQHLLAKLEVRDPPRFKTLQGKTCLVLHPLFHQVEGGIEDWELA